MTLPYHKGNAHRSGSLTGCGGGDDDDLGGHEPGGDRQTGGLGWRSMNSRTDSETGGSEG